MERNPAFLKKGRAKNALKGFTLVELAVVVGIILLFSVLIFPNFKSGRKNLALLRSASKLSQDIRRAQNMAMSSKGSFGIKIDKNSSNYILFIDSNNDHIYNISEEIELLVLEEDITVSGLFPDFSPLNITFSPPDPVTNFNPDSSTISIVISNGEKQKTIFVNKAGLIYAQ
ncbi:MAG: type II secretion system protein [bacterium]